MSLGGGLCLWVEAVSLGGFSVSGWRPVSLSLDGGLCLCLWVEVGVSGWRMVSWVEACVSVSGWCSGWMAVSLGGVLGGWWYLWVVFRVDGGISGW